MLKLIQLLAGQVKCDLERYNLLKPCTFLPNVLTGHHGLNVPRTRRTDSCADTS